MKGKIIWHAYPEDRPGGHFEFGKLLLVTCVHAKLDKAFVHTMWSTVGGGFPEVDGVRVVAWAEMPEPYEKEEKDVQDN